MGALHGWVGLEGLGATRTPHRAWGWGGLEGLGPPWGPPCCLGLGMLRKGGDPKDLHVAWGWGCLEKLGTPPDRCMARGVPEVTRYPNVVQDWGCLEGWRPQEPPAMVFGA